MAKEKSDNAQNEEEDLIKQYENLINSELGKNSDSEYENSEDTRFYLYNKGNEYEAITGGWNIGLITGTSSDTGSAIKYSNYVEIKTWGYWNGFGITTVNSIDFKDYSKLCVDFYDTSWQNISGGYDQLAILYGGITKIYYTNDIQDKIYENDISEMNDKDQIQIMAGNGGNAKIRAVWLEK